MPGMKMNVNARMQNPIEITLDTQVDPASITSENISLTGTRGCVPIDLELLDEKSGRISIRIAETIDPGNYELQVSEAVASPISRDVFGGVTVGLLQDQP